jgi:hypothetical protein
MGRDDEVYQSRSMSRTFVGTGVVRMQGGGACAVLVLPAAPLPPLIGKFHHRAPQETYYGLTWTRVPIGAQ